MVVVIGPPMAGGEEVLSDAALDRHLRAALAQGSLRDAVAAVTEATGAPRRRIYARALTLSDEAR
jgi:16S rRNA (cytidine1402-2'-O)-methyltransferase